MEILFDFVSVSSQLYCKFGDIFYKVGETWQDTCNVFNCTAMGVLATPIYSCSLLTPDRESFRCRKMSIEKTDQPRCCTDEIFCSQLPPSKYGSM